MSKNKNSLLITFLLGAFAIFSLVTMILYFAGVGVNGFYQASSGGHASASWGTSLLVFGGNDGLQDVGASGGLIAGFVFALTALILAALALIGTYVSSLKKAVPALAILGGISLLISGILLVNILNLAVDGKGNALFVDSMYSSLFNSLTTGAAPIIGLVSALLGVLSAGIATTILLRSK
jgi:hypothetical protein